MVYTIKNNLSRSRLITGLVTTLFFTLPFERIPTIDLGFYTIKISYILGLLILCALLPKLPSLIKDWRLGYSDWLLIAFWLVSFITIFSSPDVKRSLLVFAMWSFMFVLYLVLPHLIVGDSVRDRLEKALIAVTVIVCVFGIFQFLGDSYGLSSSLTGLRPQYTKAVFGFPRIQSVGLEPLYFGNFLLVPLFLIMNGYIRQKGLINKYWYILVLVLVNVILGIARGVYAALFITTVLLLIYLFINGKKYVGYRRQAAGLILAGATAGIIAIGMVQSVNGQGATSNFVEHAAVVDDVKGGGESVVGRMANFKNAWRLFKDKPILGQGVGSYGVLSTTEKSRLGGGFGVVNNEYLEILAETGAVGFSLFALFLTFYLRDLYLAWRKREGQEKLYLVSVFLGITAIFIQYNFFSTLYIIHVWVFLALLRAEINQTALAKQHGN